MIEILHEDNDILVCVKPAGMAVQSSSVTSEDMETVLRSQILRSGTFKNKSTLLHVIHRLDQPVEGIIVFARTKKAAASLSKQVQADGDMSKVYRAVVYGEFADKEGKLTDYLGKDPVTKKAIVAADNNGNNKGFKESILDYKVLSTKGITEVSTNNVVDFDDNNKMEQEKISLVEIYLKTGRYHQIRAQFSNAGHPLLGDRRYMSEVSDEVSARLRVRNVALCACRLEFKHPVTNKIMKFEIEPQGDIFKEF
ncbi:RluA family pseudouridine synthase [Butyrivibrio sp. XPD2002]|uniref:RluA family pseudouridine synthase n=1 Tax=Butyrivibrio sp. XPD2002 TaxID=1280665 RepID=UPI0004253D0A|nr:RluA family pseudouridine synthase [Butyrivibrio sp. XPD2002]